MTAGLTEERWTPPRTDCPHPGRWHSVDDESTELEVSELVAAFVRALQPDLAIETGAGFGQTTAAITKALRRNRHGVLLTCEPNPQRAAIVRERVPGVALHEGPSFDLIAGLAPDTVGFAWLDSLIDLRVAEARALRPALRVGAVVGFHDTGPQHGYRPSVEALFTEGWLRGIHLPTPRGVMFAEVLG